jgi:hypothetical protein
MILSNVWIVTMDDAGTEYERRWLPIEDGLIAELGSGPPPAHISEEVVRDGRLVNGDEKEIAREHRMQAARLD